VSVNLSSIIMELEIASRKYEKQELRREQMADLLEHEAEQLFRLAARVRHGKENP
jgi:hypothetical protein